MNTLLSAHNLTKEYHSTNQNTIALFDVSFDVEQGSFVSIVGPSGSGKSTLLRILSGLEQATSGEIELHKKNIVMGFVAQQYTLFPWLSVSENIEFGLNIKKIPEREKERIIKKYLVLTGLEKFKDSLPRELSGGMQQRVAIARTLATNPDIVFMDEPFGALDVQTRSSMQEFLVKILKEEKKTIVMVTHDIEEALYMSDSVILLSTKPGQVKDILIIPFVKTRKPELKNSTEFLEMKKSISYTLKSEFIKSTTDETLQVSKDNELVIGSNIWTGIAPLYLAREKGLFTKHGINPAIATIEWSIDRVQPLRDKKVDVLYTTLDSALLEIKKDPNMEIFMPLDVSKGGDALITHPSITSVKELKEKIVGVEEGWVSHFFLKYILALHNLSERDVVIKNIKASDMGRELLLGNISAAVVQEPWLTKIKEYTSCNVLTTTRDYHPLIYGVLLVRKDILESKKVFLYKFRLAWFEALTLLEKFPAESITAIAPYIGLSEIELAEQLQTIEFNNLEKDLKLAINETKRILENF